MTSPNTSTGQQPSRSSDSSYTLAPPKHSAHAAEQQKTSAQHSQLTSTATPSTDTTPPGTTPQTSGEPTQHNTEPTPPTPPKDHGRPLTTTERFFVSKLLKKLERNLIKKRRQRDKREDDKHHKELVLRLLEFYDLGFDFLDDNNDVIPPQQFKKMTTPELLDYTAESIRVLRTRVTNKK